MYIKNTLGFLNAQNMKGGEKKHEYKHKQGDRNKRGKNIIHIIGR